MRIDEAAPVNPRILLNKLTITAGYYPVVLLDGPRQSGKTTLTRAAFPDKAYVTLEPLDTREFARTDPRGFPRSTAVARSSMKSSTHRTC